MSHDFFVRFCSDLERGSTMRSETRLDFVVFQLTPTRTRCELLVSAGGVTEKLASGLLKPFLAHLKAAEEEIERGGYSIKLVPFFADSDNLHGAAWFTKGTIERFVRFVSTPEVLERVSSVEAELVQIEEAISIQASEARVDEQVLRTSSAPAPHGSLTVQVFNTEKCSFSTKSRRNSIDSTDVAGGDSSKWRLLRAMDARRLMLQKEQGMAFARAAAAGFDMEHMEDLIAFADCFGACRLREACVKFMALCKKRQEAGLWMGEMEMAAAEAAANRPEGPEYIQGSVNFSRGKEYNDTWSDLNSEAGDESRDDMSMRSHKSFYPDGRGFPVEEDLKRRRSSQEDSLGDMGGEYGPSGGYRPRGRYSQGGGVAPPSIDELQASAYAHETIGRPYSLSPGGHPGSRVPVDQGMYQVEHGYEYRGAHAQGARGGIANQSPRYVQSYHGISPSTSPASGLPSWAPPDEEQNYDTRVHYGTAQPSGSGNMHGALYPGHYGLGLHTGYGDDGNYLQWRQGENQGNWPSQQLVAPSQYWQGIADSGDEPRSQHYGDTMTAPEAHYINHSLAHQRGSRSPDLRGLSNTQVMSSAPGTQPFLRPESSERQEISDSQPEVKQPALDTQFSETLAAAQECSEDKGINSVGNIGQSSTSVGGKQALSPVDSANRRLARRSTSPRRRSSSPLRKVQVGRSGGRRSGLVVIRNINYIASSFQDRAAVAKDHGSDNESDNSESEDYEDKPEPRTEDVRFSVKDAINLFEKKRNESGEAVKKSSRQESTGSGSLFNERVKRWSEVSARLTKEEDRDEDSEVYSKQGSCTVDQDVGGDNSILNHSKSEEEEVESRPTDPAEQEEQQTDASFPLVSAYGGRTASRSLTLFDAEVSSYHQVPKYVLPGKEPTQPGRDEKRTQKEPSAQLNVGQVGVQGCCITESKADECLMLRDRGEQKERGSWAVDLESEVLSAQVKDAVQDDSFIIPARMQDQLLIRRTAVNMESEISADQASTGGAEKMVDSSSFKEDLMYIPERNTGRDSLARQWNTHVDYDIEFYGEGEKGEDGRSVVGENESPKDQQGRFYQQYREKRDAKLREQPGPKRAEREAKLKAMQEVLEKQKAEMASRSGGRTSESIRYAVTADAQLRAEKLRQFKAGLLESKRKKEEEERKRIDEIRMQRRERIAARSSPTGAASGSHSASSTPRATKHIPATLKANSRLSPSKNMKVGTSGAASRAAVLSSPKAIPGKMATAGTIAGPRRAQNASTQPAFENPLSRSVPSLVDFRKENTKPTGRSSSGDKVGGSARLQGKLISTMPRSKSANDASPLESNVGLSSRSVVRATVLPDDKKRRSVSSRKSIPTVTELKSCTNVLSTETVSTPLKASKETVSEPAVTRVVKRTLAAPAGAQEAKPFLRKGTGIGPGSGAVVRKLKSSQTSETTKSVNEDILEAFLVATADIEGCKDQGDLEAANSAVAALLVVASDGKLQDTVQPEEPQDAMQGAGNRPGFMLLASPVQEAGDCTLQAVDVYITPPHNTTSEEPLAVDQASEEPCPRRREFMEEARTVDEVKAVVDSPPRAPVAPVVGNEEQSYLAPVSRLSPAEFKFMAFPQVSSLEDYNAPVALASPSPSQATVAPNIEDYEFVLASPSDTLVPNGYQVPVAVVTTSPTVSPPAVSQLQRSLSPDPHKVGAIKSMKKGNSHKASSAQQGAKDPPRGFKRLLNFGRRNSKGNMANASEWASASTASEGDDDANHTKGGPSRLSDIPNKNVESSTQYARARRTSNGKSSNNLRYMGDSPESLTTESNGSGGRGSVRVESPDKHLHGPNLLKVPRTSFFSLSSFRSKNDSKYRA